MQSYWIQVVLKQIYLTHRWVSNRKGNVFLKILKENEDCLKDKKDERFCLACHLFNYITSWTGLEKLLLRPIFTIIVQNGSGVLRHSFVENVVIHSLASYVIRQQRVLQTFQNQTQFGKKIILEWSGCFRGEKKKITQKTQENHQHW